MDAGARLPRTGGGDTDGGRRWVALMGVLAAIVVVAQVVQAPRTFDPARVIFSADGAQGAFRLNAVAMVIATLAVLLAPARWRPAVAAASVLPLAGLVALCTVGVPVRGWAVVVGILTMTACWEIGERALRALGATALSALAPVAWLAGAGIATAVLTLFGRIGLLYWWLFGVPVLALGALGAYRLARLAWPARQRVVEAVSGSRLGTACFVLMALDLAWLATYTFAPDLGYDSLEAKAWLPQHWAAIHQLDPVHLHPKFAIAGAPQVLAIPGHLVGAHDVGKWMQYVSGLALAASVWAFGRRFGALGPLAAFAVVATPTFSFQTGTAFDDLVLTLAMLALTLAVFTALEDRAPATRRPVAVGAALGLLGGSVAVFKLHLLYLDAGLLLGWIAMGGPRPG
ncbi:MAG: hypothetical protein QOF76_911, partial [Solirubrobacteraceae bacterium]|nr:hypothetical protein [Solirubrobacteraceae bacterium]